jgi:hypothetical protein
VKLGTIYNYLSGFGILLVLLAVLGLVHLLPGRVHTDDWTVRVTDGSRKVGDFAGATSVAG